MTVAGFTSTGSKRPDLLFGGDLTGLPQRMTGSRGCTVRGADGREYLDFLMGLGAVALGYGDPLVDAAAIEAVRRGTIGALAPQDEAPAGGLWTITEGKPSASPAPSRGAIRSSVAAIMAGSTGAVHRPACPPQSVRISRRYPSTTVRRQRQPSAGRPLGWRAS